MKAVLAVLLLLFTSLSFGQIQGFQRDLTVPVDHAGTQLTNPWVGGMNSVQFSTIDLNFDNQPDLFAFDRTSDKVITYINTGTPGNISYDYAPEYETDFPNLINWALLVDYNCDGKKDIFTSGTGGISVYLNNSSPGNGIQFDLAPGLVNDVIYSQQFNNYINLYVSNIDLPAIVDVDNDGDVDVLTFSFFGGFLEYHKNLSVETYGTCDSLNFELKNACWGHFEENAINNSVTLNVNCSPQVSNPEYPTLMQQVIQDEIEQTNRGGARHSGSSVTAFDQTGEGVKEVILGDISFTNLVSLTNGGTTVNSDSYMVSYDSVFPSYDVSTDLWLFPAAFYEDMNNDGARDLLVSPNSLNQAEDIQSVWFYENTANDSIPVFSFQKEDQFQEDMIDVGTASMPVFFDYNNDGLEDLFVANLGAYDRPSNTYIPAIAQYENIGTPGNPAFELVTMDYEGLSSMGLATSIYPTFGDIDDDGDKDMMLGDANGNIHYFQNIAPAGFDADFALAIPLFQDDQGATIDVGYNSAPIFADMNRDSLLDLVIGCKDGNLWYYQNVGTSIAPDFKFMTSTFGDVNTKTIWDQYGHSIPAIWDHNGEYEFLVGSTSGYLFWYDSIDNNLGGEFNLKDSLTFLLYTGDRSAPTLHDFDGDSLPELALGNYRGGIGFFNGLVDTTVTSTPRSWIPTELNLYPVPTSEMLIVEMQEGSNSPANYTVHDLLGRTLLTGRWASSGRNFLDVGSLSNGHYILSVEIDGFHTTGRFIKN